jgi:hypothetical protein
MSCSMQVTNNVWTDAVCAADLPPDGGAPDASPAPDAGAGADAAADHAGTTGSSDGCSCVFSATGRPGAAAAGLVLSLLIASRRRRARRQSNRPRNLFGS